MSVTAIAAELHNFFLNFFFRPIFPLFASLFPIEPDKVSQLGSKEPYVLILAGNNPVGNENNSGLQLTGESLLVLLAKG